MRHLPLRQLNDVDLACLKSLQPDCGGFNLCDTSASESGRLVESKGTDDGLRPDGDWELHRGPTMLSVRRWTFAVDSRQKFGLLKIELVECNSSIARVLGSSGDPRHGDLAIQPVEINGC